MPRGVKRRGRALSRERSVGTTYRVRNMSRSRSLPRGTTSRRVNALYSMIETKEGSNTIVNVGLPHNNIHVWNVNPLFTTAGTGDPLQGIGNRIGDKVSLKGMAACFFLEGAVGRSKVHFRIMLMKGPRGASFSRADMYKGMAGNKVIDQLNTEKYTIIAQKRFNVEPPNAPPDAFNVVNGEVNASLPAGITGNKVVKFWIPGRKFGKGGTINYENGTDLPKFYDYRWCFLAYDWYGTPQDVNTVGFINEGWLKLYYKDA